MTWPTPRSAGSPPIWASSCGRSPRFSAATAPSNKPAVTVVLLVYEPTARDARTAGLVRAQVYDGDVRILAIDSSTDPDGPNNRILRDAADAWESIPPAEFGHGSTRNRAADACTTPLIAYLSQDAHPIDDRWLSELIAPIVAGRAVAAYGRQRAPEDAGGAAERTATFDYLYPDTPEIKTKADVARMGLRAFHFSDVTSAFDADVLRAVRFPEDLPTFEDIGVAKRLLDRGDAIAYVPTAVVAQGEALDSRGLVRRYRQIGAIYERLGIFADLRLATGRGLARQGLGTAQAVSPSGNPAKRAAIAALKAAAVGIGRLEAKVGRRLPRR